MRTETNTMLARQLRGGAHRMLVADVAAAGDVRAGDERPDLFFAGRAFAEVGAEIDHSSVPLVSGRSQIRIAPRAKKMASAAMAKPRPCLVAAAPMAYGAAAETRRPAL